MGQRILLVDSDTRASEERRDVLERHGLQVEVVEDGPAALTAAEREFPALVLLTVELRGMNGFLVCKKFRKHSDLGQVPIVLLSQEASEESFEQHRQLRVRADEYLRLPLPDDELLAVVGRFVTVGTTTSLMADPGVALDDEVLLVEDEDMIVLSDDEEISEGGVRPSLGPPATPSVLPRLSAAPPMAMNDQGSFTGANIEVPVSSAPPSMLESGQAGLEIVPPAEDLGPLGDDVGLEPPAYDALELAEQAALGEPYRSIEESGAPALEVAGTPSRPHVALDGAGSNQQDRAELELEYARVAAELERLRAQLAVAEQQIHDGRAQARAEAEAHAASVELALREEQGRSQSLSAELVQVRARLEQLAERPAPSLPPGGHSSGREALELRQQLNSKDRELLQLREQVTDRDKLLLEANDRSLALEASLADARDEQLATAQQLEDLRGQHHSIAQQAAGLQQQLSAEQARAQQLDSDLVASRQAHAELTTLRAQEQQAHADEIARLHESREEERSRTAAVHAATLAERDERMAAAIADGEGRLAAATAEFQQVLAQRSGEHDEELRGLRDGHTQAVEELRARHSAELAAQGQAAQQAQELALAEQLALLEQQKADALHVAEQTRQTDLAAQAQAAQQAQEVALAEQQQRLEQSHAEASRLAEEAHNAAREAALQELRQAHQGELARVGRMLQQTEERLSRSQQQAEELSSTLHIVSAERDQAQSHLAQLQQQLAELREKITHDAGVLLRVRKAMAIGLGLMEMVEETPPQVAEDERVQAG